MHWTPRLESLGVVGVLILTVPASPQVLKWEEKAGFLPHQCSNRVAVVPSKVMGGQSIQQSGGLEGFGEKAGTSSLQEHVHASWPAWLQEQQSPIRQDGCAGEWTGL